MNRPLFTSVRVGRTATRDELDALDATVGGLPPSYRRFAATYGAGRINALFLIFMPFRCPSGALDRQNDRIGAVLGDVMASRIADGDAPGDPDCLEAYDEASVGVAARYRDLVFFASSENGELLCWLRTGDRYAFHVLDRAFLSVRHGGNDLLAMIGDMQTPKVKDVLGTGYAPLPAIFEGLD